tara:strand:- start:20084 stop:20569 length:486 start_codon:yes stop_codon:yes gene_type:complete
MDVSLIDALVILAHPLAGMAAAYFLYKQWSGIKSVRRKSNTFGMSPEQKEEIRNKHQIMGKKAPSIVAFVILLAIAAEIYRGIAMDVPFTELMSLHGLLGALLLVATISMSRTGRSMTSSKPQDYHKAPQRNIHSKIGGAMMWLLTSIVFLGFLRLLEVLG